MKKVLFLLTLLFPVFILVSPARAELDLDKEVLIIPDTHNEKPYIWHVQRNPQGYELLLPDNPVKADEEHLYIFKILTPSGMSKGDVHVFITDDDLHSYAHQKATRTGDDYRFTDRAPRAGKYRIEVVFQTQQGWVELSRDVKVVGGPAAAHKLPGDEDYQVKVKLIPKKAYAEHVVTVLYEIFYKGKPVTGLEKLDGYDMQVAAWDEHLKEFIYATPKQNLGGPEVAVSIVFMKPGKHAVFAEFKHKDIVRKVDSVISVYQEPIPAGGSFINLRPSD